MAKFTRITQSAENFNKAVELFESMTDRFDFDGLVAEYKQLGIGELTQFEYKRGKSSVIRQQLAKRGLVPGDLV